MFVGPDVVAMAPFPKLLKGRTISPKEAREEIARSGGTIESRFFERDADTLRILGEVYGISVPLQTSPHILFLRRGDRFIEVKVREEDLSFQLFTYSDGK
jgi:hypothetical protein